MTKKALSSCRGGLGAGLMAAGLTALVSGAGGSRLAAQPDAGALVDPRLYQDLRWRSVGPHRGGRVTAVAGHRAQPSTFYMGATGGGVWKTTDYGITWHPVSDGFFETGSIGAIEVAESDPNLVYVGTGSDGIRSNVIVGRGMYKSTDGGKTWTFIGLRNAGQIGAVKVHPRDPDLVYAAALGSPFGPNPDRGVFRSRDGGKSWQKVLYVSEKVGAISLAMNPQEPAEIYAALWRGERKPWTIISGAPASEGPGIYRTRDGGETWTKLSKGLPQGLVGKIDLDVARSNPRRVYALIEAPGSERGLYRSDDSGETWQQVNGEFNLLRRPFYYTNVDADPKDPEVVYVSNEQFFKSTDGGKTLRRMGTPHGDNHGVWINPDHPEIFIQCNDGGANVTQNGGRTWSTQLNQPTAELYMVDVDDQFPYRLYAPQQDNSTLIAPSLPPVAWRLDAPTQVWIHGPGCETGQIHPRPDGQVVYGVCKGEFGRYSLETGQEKHYWVYPQNRYGHNPRDMKYRFVRQSPLEVSPHDPKVVYHGSQYLHRTSDDGATWQTISPDLTANEPGRQVISGEPITRDITGEEVHSALYAIEESRLEKGVVWTGSSDGPVHVTRDGGRTWKNVTPKDLPPDGRVMNIEDSPHRRGSAYIAVSRHLLDDFRPYIYATRDYGATWTRLTDGTNGIPADHPTRAIREDPARAGLLYAGTEFGVFVSFDGGQRWQTLQQNLPATPVTDIRVHRGDLVISTMGRAFWILDDISPLRQLAATPVGGGGRTTGRRLFLPREAYRLRYSASSGRPDVPEYPPAAARIDYVVETPSEADLKLEILGPEGGVIRAFSSAAPAAAGTGERGGEEEEMGGPRSGPALPTRLPTKAGMNRFLWDLRHAGAWDRRSPDGAPGGPYVAPGRYQVRLSVGAWSQTQPLVVRIDPRVAADGVTQADLEEQAAFSLKVRNATSDARRLAERVREAREKAEGDGAASAKLQQLLDRLVTARGAYPQPMLIDQIGNVARMLGQADQRVGRDAYIRVDDLMKELRALEAEAAKRVGAGASEGGR
jgi:photosystem II stability/assembly factor-like uncharacterized protein